MPRDKGGGGLGPHTGGCTGLLIQHRLKACISLANTCSSRVLPIPNWRPPVYPEITKERKLRSPKVQTRSSLQRVCVCHPPRDAGARGGNRVLRPLRPASRAWRGQSKPSQGRVSQFREPGWGWERGQETRESARERERGGAGTGVTMPPSTSSWSSVRSSTTLGLREPAAAREPPRQQPGSGSSSSRNSSARLQERRWRGLCRPGPPAPRGRCRMADRAPGGTPGRCVRTRRRLKGERPRSRGESRRTGESRGLGSGVFSPGAVT